MQLKKKPIKKRLSKKDTKRKKEGKAAASPWKYGDQKPLNWFGGLKTRHPKGSNILVQMTRVLDLNGTNLDVNHLFNYMFFVDI